MTGLAGQRLSGVCVWVTGRHTRAVISALPEVKLGAERRDPSQLLRALKRKSAIDVLKRLRATWAEVKKIYIREEIRVKWSYFSCS